MWNSAAEHEGGGQLLYRFVARGRLVEIAAVCDDHSKIV